MAVSMSWENGMDAATLRPISSTMASCGSRAPLALGIVGVVIVNEAFEDLDRELDEIESDFDG